MSRRAVVNSFAWVAVNVAHPEWGPGLRAHYFADCDRISANGCRPEQVPAMQRDPDRPLCYTCIGRLVAKAEA